MKQIILAIITVFISSSLVRAQNTPDKLKEDFLQYSQLIIDHKVEESMDYMIEEIFEVIPKTKLINMMSQLLIDKDVEMRLILPEIDKISKSIERNDKIYRRFISNNEMQIKFKNQSDSLDQDETLARIKLYLINNYGFENVSYNESSDFFTIRTKKNVIAKLNKNGSKWQFAIVDTPDRKKLLEGFVPKEVLPDFDEDEK